MFKSFFPRPTMFFLSVIVWTTVCVAAWFLFSNNIANALGINIALDPNKPVIGLAHFYTNSFLFFSAYYFLSIIIFAVFWFKFSPHKWQYWSILGSALIMYSTYFSVQVSVALNAWRRPFGDTLIKAFNKDATEPVTAQVLYDLLLIFLSIVMLMVAVFVLTRFFVSHYVFRWRTAMNEYYTEHWKKLRNIEGASQRVQEDTMIFAKIVEGLGVSIVDSVMTLFAFLPILWSLSSYVTTLPVIGEIPAPLFQAVIFWSLLGTVLLITVGIKLPGLEFNNQKVEAAYRKELVYGEDNEERANPATLRELFNNVRKNYFRIYFHYAYFNIARSFYLQLDNIFAYVILIPTIIAGTITYGIFQQILTAFSQVGSSFQLLVHSWPTIIELISVRKRLKAFEATLKDEELSGIEKEQDFKA